MNEEKAKSILSNHLGSEYLVLECFDKTNGIFQFYVKEKKYANEDFVLPNIFGVDNSGKVLSIEEILEIERSKKDSLEKEAG